MSFAICPACNKRKIADKKVFEMYFNGRLVDVCGDCYHEAYLKTNIKRILSNRGHFLSSIRGKSEI